MAVVQVDTNKKGRGSRVTFLILLIVAVCSALYMTAPYLLSITMGAILAVISYPVYRFLRKHRWGPRLASLLVSLGLFLLVIAPVTLFSVAAIKQGISVVNYVSNNQKSFSFDRALQKVTQWRGARAILGDPQALNKQLTQSLRQGVNKASAMILGIVAKIPNLILQLFLLILTTYFLLPDGPSLIRWLSKNLPLQVEVRDGIISSFKNTAISSIWAGFIVAVVQAIVMTFAFLVLGIPATFLAGGATFVFAWIPLVGTTPVWIAGAIYLYATGSIAKTLVMFGFGIFAGIIDNLIRPWILKGRDEMHPLISLVAIFGGVSLFGMFGVFVGPIVAAITIALLQAWPRLQGPLLMAVAPVAPDLLNSQRDKDQERRGQRDTSV